MGFDFGIGVFALGVSNFFRGIWDWIRARYIYSTEAISNWWNKNKPGYKVKCVDTRARNFVNTYFNRLTSKRTTTVNDDGSSRTVELDELARKSEAARFYSLTNADDPDCVFIANTKFSLAPPNANH